MCPVLQEIIRFLCLWLRGKLTFYEKVVGVHLVMGDTIYWKIVWFLNKANVVHKSRKRFCIKFFVSKLEIRLKQLMIIERENKTCQMVDIMGLKKEI